MCSGRPFLLEGFCWLLLSLLGFRVMGVGCRCRGHSEGFGLRCTFQLLASRPEFRLGGCGLQLQASLLGFRLGAHIVAAGVAARVPGACAWNCSCRRECVQVKFDSGSFGASQSGGSCFEFPCFPAEFISLSLVLSAVILIEPKAVDSHIVLRDPMLDSVLERCCLSKNPWDRIQNDDLQRTSLLRLLSVLASASKETLRLLGFMVQYAALRLASYDLLVGSGRRLSATRKGAHVLRSFDKNMALFSKSWKLTDELPIHLRIQPLDALIICDLHYLRARIVGGWQVEIDVMQGDGHLENSHVWVTPLQR